jgi:hypothetical protein
VFEEFLADQKGRISAKTRQDLLEIPDHHRPLRVVHGKLLARS